MTTEQPRDAFVSVNGLRLHYLEWGEAGQPPIVLLHGGSAHARWWTFFVRAFEPGHRLLALDLRGHGDSDRAVPPAYSLADHAADVRAFIAAAGLSSFTLIGHSFGGLVAIEYASATPERLAQLIIVDTRTHLTERGVRFMSSLRFVPKRVYGAHAEAVRSFRLLPDAPAPPPAALNHVASHAYRETADGTWVLKFDRRALGRPEARDLSVQLATVPCPLLFVRGTFSEVVSAAEIAEIARAIPRMQVVEIADAHHHVMLDQPEALATVVRRFVRENHA